VTHDPLAQIKTENLLLADDAGQNWRGLPHEAGHDMSLMNIALELKHRTGKTQRTPNNSELLAGDRGYRHYSDATR